MENQFISENEDFQIVQLLERYLSQWPWFVLSVMLCCAIAVIYLKSTPVQYKRTANVLIKEEEKDITAAFGGRSSFRAMADVNNEIEVFKSPQLTQEVIRRLKLDINYLTKDGLRKKDLYSQSPIIAEFLESENFSFKVEFLQDGVIVISDFVKAKDRSKRKQRIETQLNKETETPFGNIMISPSLYYSYDEKYKAIEVSKGNLKLTGLSTVQISLTSKVNTVLSLEIEDVSIQRAEDILTSLINVYRENWVNEKNTVINTNLVFLDERIDIAAQELMDLDNRLAIYKSRNLVVTNAASMQMNQSMEYSRRIQDLSNQISIAEFIQIYLNDNTKLFELLPNTTGVNNSALESQISNYNTLLADRNRLAANSSELNPMIVERNKSLQSLRQLIIQTVDNLITSLNFQLSGLQAQEMRMTGNIASRPGQERHLMTIERELKIKESLYQYLLQQREENSMALIITPTNSRVISAPFGGSKPVKPNKFKILLIALMAGCGIPFGIIMARDFLNATIRDKRDLAGLPVPLLGVIPEVKIGTEKKMLIVEAHGRGATNESFRILRTSLRFASPKDTKVIQITSMDSHAGKTFIALNLAMSFAVTGKKIALLDMDLRRRILSNLIDPRLTDIKWDNPKEGIVDILNEIDEGKNIADVLKKRVHDMNPFIKSTLDKKDLSKEAQNMPPVIFDFIYAGAEPPNPVELLMHDGLGKLIEKLKTMYDYIFIDSTPVHPIVDAVLVAEQVDVSLFVVREKVTDRRKLPDIKNIFRKEKLEKMLLVLNGSFVESKSNRNNAYYMSNNEKDKYLSVFVKTIYNEIKNKVKNIIKQMSANNKTQTEVNAEIIAEEMKPETPKETVQKPETKPKISTPSKKKSVR